MYEDHFGLTDRPFQLTPDPAFWFDSATHAKAMAYLGYGLAQGEGFIVVTGEVGAGKTTLVAHLLETLDRSALNPVHLVSTQVGGDDMLGLTAEALGVDTAGMGKAALLGAIERALHRVAREGRRTLLIVDEAQALAPSAIEELRMLSNFTAGGHALLQIVLVGQPEFRALLAGEGAIEQLRQRVIATHHLEPMEREEVEPYLAHRLARVGWKGRPDFTPAAAAALHRASGGIPRLVNQLAGRAMLAASLEQQDVIDADLIQAVVADQASEAPQPSRPVTSAAATPADPPRAAPKPDIATQRRLAELEQRLTEQDAALRRVLELLVDWAEGGEQRLPVLHGSAA